MKKGWWAYVIGFALLAVTGLLALAAFNPFSLMYVTECSVLNRSSQPIRALLLGRNVGGEVAQLQLVVAGTALAASNTELVLSPGELRTIHFDNEHRKLFSMLVRAADGGWRIATPRGTTFEIFNVDDLPPADALLQRIANEPELRVYVDGGTD